MLQYAVRLWLQHHRPVHSAVIYLLETTAHLADTFIVARGDGEETLRMRFDVVRLSTVPAEDVLTRPEPALWPLPALMAGPILETVTEVAQRLGLAPH